MKNLKKHFYKKKIIITGHTGFKGSWLTLWLQSYGAKIYGISNGYPSNPSNFKILRLSDKINHKIMDLRNLSKLKKMINKIKPDYIFHLAAQSLVKESFENPINTFTSNSIGTCNVLESIRHLKNKCVVIIITSDKSYKNLEIKRGYHEEDLIGGIDPYSASKGCAELIIKSYYESFLKKNTNIKIGISRAGNVIGGGDWSKNRIIPDCIRAWSNRRFVSVRNPKSTRPWQHVLEVLYGYLKFASKLKKDKTINGHAFNFGPNKTQDKTVNSLLCECKKHWINAKWISKKDKSFAESSLLKLNSSKASKKLQWFNSLSFFETVKMTIQWYLKYLESENMYEFSINQIKKYETKIKN